MEQGMIIATPTERQKIFVDALAQWLRKWARIHSIDRREPIKLSEEDFAAYGEALCDLMTPEQLDAACLRAEQTCRWFPKPADILEHVEKAGDSALDLEAQHEWEKALDFSSNCWHPDTGFSRHAPQLSPVTWHALKVAGGLSHLFNCSRDELQWARKRFIEDYTLIHQTRQNEHLLTVGRAKEIVRELAARPPQAECKRLAVAKESPTSKPSREEVRAALCKTVGLDSPPTKADLPKRKSADELWKEIKAQEQGEPPTETELRRTSELLAQAELLKRNRPELWKAEPEFAEIDRR